MSLRLRLNLVYAALLGGAILLFGALVYGLVNWVLVQQVDNTLYSSANQLIERLRVGSTGQFDPRSISGFATTDNLLIQVWGNDRKLQISRPLGESTALDEVARQSGRITYSYSVHNTLHLRTYTVPLETERGPVGLLQVGINLQLFDVTLSTLATVLLLLAIIAMVLSILAAWFMTGRALAPLSTVTQVATQITRADDLGRRIPLSDNPDDEVGQLIQAFNETMERLEQLFTMQRRFLADVSHELRTPLTVIKGNVGLIRKVGADEESLGSIETEVDRLTRLVGDLLFLAQAESGQVPFDLSAVELDAILLEVFQQMRVLAGERVSISIDEIDQIQVKGDRDRLKQVMLNLVGNAIQYTPAGGKVKLALGRVEEQAWLKVSDSGPGIPTEDLPHIFERFYRGEKSRHRSANSGFGLGLSIAYYIITFHQGTIEVESGAGKGTTFIVRLPAIPSSLSTGSGSDIPPADA
jgi:two-component system OmpR family sensor kinase